MIRRAGAVVAFGAAALVVALQPACTARHSPGAVRIGVPFELSTLDPHAEDKLSNMAVIFNNLYDGLVSLDDEMKIRPALAESWENREPTSWTFHLRRGVEFHSGRRLTSADVVYSFRRLLDSPALQMRSYIVAVSDVRAVGEYDVEIRTRAPSPVFLNRVANVMIVPDGSAAESLRGGADGTGPYELAEWRPGELLRLRRQDKYWTGLPGSIPEAEISLALSPREALTGLMKGLLDVVRCDSKIVERADDSPDRFEILKRDNIYVKYLAYDLARDVTPHCALTPNPFKDRRVRQALSRAIDRRALVQGIQGYGVPVGQPVPRMVFGFSPRLQDDVYEPERARALLAEAGLGDGFRVTLHARRIVADAAALVRDDLKRVGIELDVIVLPDADFFNLMDRRGATFWLNRFGCATADASDFLDYFVHSSDPVRGLGALNYGGYSDPTIDRAIERSAETDSLETRRDMLQDLMGRIAAETVVVPLYVDQDVYAIDRRFAWRPRADSGIQIAEIRARARGNARD